jgi:hypothetical protein
MSAALRVAAGSAASAPVRPEPVSSMERRAGDGAGGRTDARSNAYALTAPALGPGATANAPALAHGASVKAPHEAGGTGGAGN